MSDKNLTCFPNREFFKIKNVAAIETLDRTHILMVGLLKISFFLFSFYRRTIQVHREALRHSVSIYGAIFPNKKAGSPSLNT